MLLQAEIVLKNLILADYTNKSTPHSICCRRRCCCSCCCFFKLPQVEIALKDLILADYAKKNNVNPNAISVFSPPPTPRPRLAARRTGVCARSARPTCTCA